MIPRAGRIVAQGSVVAVGWFWVGWLGREAVARIRIGRRVKRQAAAHAALERLRAAGLAADLPETITIDLGAVEALGPGTPYEQWLGRMDDQVRACLKTRRETAERLVLERAVRLPGRAG